MASIKRKQRTKAQQLLVVEKRRVKRRNKKQRQQREAYAAATILPTDNDRSDVRNSDDPVHAMNAVKTLLRFAWAMVKIAFDCFRHPLSNTHVNY